MFGSVVDRFFFPIGKFRISKAKAIRIIPETETISADSFGRIIQLKIAPATGIRNFQTLSSETLTSGRRKSVFQMEIEAADKKLSHASATKYSGGKDCLGNPSNGSEMKIMTNPPIKSDDEVKIIGEMECRLRAITTFEIPDDMLLSIK